MAAPSINDILNNGPYHSQLNDVKVKEYCGCGVFPLRTKNGQDVEDAETEEDIVDEVLFNFKANMLFQQYTVKGSGDRTLLYLTLYANQVLRIAKDKTQEEARRALTELKHQSFQHPGDKGFPLAGFLTAPSNSEEAENWKAYMTECRAELNLRLLPKLYLHPTAQKHPDKFWMMFAKRKFLGKHLN
eukprot:TRINITY_DN4339_c0_g1_i1.p1 TRINITY_DN4339_c0_g1~~TRINITY_DN4339_c0_g1_i1.p1  ORF type:complete len:187 (+),score=59.81 TRINITY_DN4339_c0_g1_i1:191-751(+)